MAVRLAEPVLTFGHRLRYAPAAGTTWATDTAGVADPPDMLRAV